MENTTHFVGCKALAGNGTAADCTCREVMVPFAQHPDWQSRALAAEAKVERMREALKPFADAGHLVPGEHLTDAGHIVNPDHHKIVTYGNEPGPYASITLGDLRNARAALEDR